MEERRTGNPKSFLRTFVFSFGMELSLWNLPMVVTGEFCGLLQIPDPQAYIVTHWGRDPYSGMAYSYIPIGSTGEEYDLLASDIGNKVFFAGEVWFKHRVSNIEVGVFCKVFNSKRSRAF